MYYIRKTAWGAEFRTLGPVARIRQKKIPGVPAGAAGCRNKDPGTRGYRWWKTAAFSHSARTAHAKRTVRPLRVEERYEQSFGA